MQGLPYAYYETGSITALPDFSVLTPVKAGVTGTLGLGEAARANNIALRFWGYISIPVDGAYTFFMTIDDEAALDIDGAEVLRTRWTDGLDSATKSLTAGMHPILLEYYQGGGGIGLDVKWRTPSNGNAAAIPSTVFFYRPGDLTTGNHSRARLAKAASRLLRVNVGGGLLTLAVPISWNPAQGLHVDLFDLRGRMVLSTALTGGTTGALRPADGRAAATTLSGNYVVRLCRGDATVVAIADIVR